MPCSGCGTEDVSTSGPELAGRWNLTKPSGPPHAEKMSRDCWHENWLQVGHVLSVTKTSCDYVETRDYKVWLHPVTKAVRDYTYRHVTTKSGCILSRRRYVTIRIDTWLQSLATSCHEECTWLRMDKLLQVWPCPVTNKSRDYFWENSDKITSYFSKKCNHMCGHASLPRCYVTICVDKWLQVWSRPVTKTSRDYFYKIK